MYITFRYQQNLWIKLILNLMFFETKDNLNGAIFFVAEKFFALYIANEWFNVICSEIYCDTKCTIL